MARECFGRDAEALRGPCEREHSSIELVLRDHFLIEVSFAEDEEMACRVVVCRRVAGNIGASQLVDVALAVDADVVGDVDPSKLVLVVPLVLTKASWRITVVAEDHAFVVEGQTCNGVGLASGAGRPGAPSVPAQHDSWTCAGRGRSHGCRRWRRDCGHGCRRWCGTCGTWTRTSLQLRNRFRTPAQDGRHDGATGEPKQLTTAGGLRVAVRADGRKCVHDGHDTKLRRVWRCYR